MRFAVSMVVLLVVAASAYRYGWRHQPDEAAVVCQPKCDSKALSGQKQDEPPETVVVRQWLDDLHKGRDGRQYWEDDMRPSILYAVQSYEIVDVLSPETYTVRIHSSTLEGLPIVRMYYVSLRGGKIFRLDAIGDAEKHFQDVVRRLSQ